MLISDIGIGKERSWTRSERVVLVGCLGGPGSTFQRSDIDKDNFTKQPDVGSNTLLHASPPTMNGHANGKLSQLPEEMFTIIKATSQNLGPRLGRLALPGRRVIDTPHYLGNTSRGVVPHITQDTFVRDTNINSIYVALEDCT